MSARSVSVKGIWILIWFKDSESHLHENISTFLSINFFHLIFVLRDISSAGLEHYLDKVGATGSNPVCPTNQNRNPKGHGFFVWIRWKFIFKRRQTKKAVIERQWDRFWFDSARGSVLDHEIIHPSKFLSKSTQAKKAVIERGEIGFDLIPPAAAYWIMK